MRRYERVDGEYLGTCRCGCGGVLFERLYLRATGSVALRSRPRFLDNHSLRVNHCDRTGAANYPVAEARKAMLLPVGHDLDALIHRRRRELGLSMKEMQVLLGWRGANNLHRYKFKPNVMPRTLHGILDRLYADEGGWVEAGKLWTLVRERQAYWGMTGDEMARYLGATEAPWTGKATARRILLALSGPRKPSEYESVWTRRLNERVERAQYRAKAIERQVA